RLTLTQAGIPYSDDVTLNVRQNKPPVVDAGPDRILALPTLGLTITGTATDDWTASGQLTYQWSLVGGPTLPAGAVLTLGPALPAGEYTYRLTVTDGALSSPPLSGIDDVKVYVTDARGRTWTRNADFEEGYLSNVEYD